jgi:colanic acid/amylovoran biosynthesis protein
MNILFDNTGRNLPNMGDAAQCQVGVNRLLKLWPDARINVITFEPGLLAAYCPTTFPIPAPGRRVLSKRGILIGQRLLNYLPGRWRGAALDMDAAMRHKWPRLALHVLRFKKKILESNVEELIAFLNAVLRADLIVIGGGGDFYDDTAEGAMTLLDILEMAIRLEKPTVMLGQGIGDIQKNELRNRAKAVLPSVNVICLREIRTGIPFLYSIGVSSERIVVTGDDAIELAYEQRPPELGDKIGVNLRVGCLSEIRESHVKAVRSVLHMAAQKYCTSLIPAPIAFNKGESDCDAIRELLAGYNGLSDAGETLDSPLKIIQQVGRCRIVVTGSYHAGVFALSQGIPVVGLAKSEYYIDKFLGLADQFGLGCEIVLLEGDDFERSLLSAIDFAWKSADNLRPTLVDAARRQVEAGHAGYQRIYQEIKRIRHHKRQ